MVKVGDRALKIFRVFVVYQIVTVKEAKSLPVFP